MDIDGIAVFIKIIETGGISAAAKSLNMPKTTVSAKLAALERRLKVSLVSRTTRKLQLTEIGEMYFNRCQPAVREIEQAEAELNLLNNQASGLLRISAPVDVGRLVMPAITSAFLKKYPKVSIELMISNQNAELITEGIDLAIRVGMLEDSSLIAKRFFELRTRLLAAPAYLQTLAPVNTPADLKHAAFVGFKGVKTLKLYNATQHAEIQIPSRVVSDDIETIKALLLNGEGIGWLPDLVATAAIEQGDLVEVLPDWLIEQSACGFYFVYPNQKYVPPKVSAFIKTAIELLPIIKP